MKVIASISLALMLAPASIGVLVREGTGMQPQRNLTKADIDRMMNELSNWGRWGKDDQLGAINLITAAKRKQATALVREGVSVSLARDTNKETAPDNPQPYEHSMTLSGVGNR